ncbi:LLM class flavin-dependent oxidoreductase [Streptomyces sp. KL116D]|uniref:LLM class flavin-dependent oxidoreductase n=1 Tax=Streptomyces sp. KL116D TaxID=3045152 RepID=UPI0035575BCA
MGPRRPLTSRCSEGKPFADARGCCSPRRPSPTSRLRVGPLVAAVPRYRPEQLARQVATLDALSGGRVVFGRAGLGGPPTARYGSRRRRQADRARRTPRRGT